jgi:hypothetical protein
LFDTKSVTIVVEQALGGLKAITASKVAPPFDPVLVGADSLSTPLSRSAPQADIPASPVTVSR